MENEHISRQSSHLERSKSSKTSPYVELGHEWNLLDVVKAFAKKARLAVQPEGEEFPTEGKQLTKHE